MYHQKLKFYIYPTIKGGSRRAEKSRKVLMMMKAAKLTYRERERYSLTGTVRFLSDVGFKVNVSVLFQANALLLMRIYAIYDDLAYQ